MDQLRVIALWILLLDSMPSALAQTLVAHWPLDKASGMTDTSGNNFHFVPSSSFSPITYTTDENGETDGATVFNTLGVPVTSPDMSALIHPLSSFTITAWVRHQSTSSDGYPFRLVDNSGNMLFHIKTTTTGLYFAGKNFDYKSYSFPVNTWYYLTIMFDGATSRPRVWVNGVDLSFLGTVHSLSGGSWIMGNGARVIVGQTRMGLSTSFNAAISNVGFYASVVTGAEQPGYMPPTPAPPPPPTTIAPTTEAPTTEASTTEAADDLLYFAHLGSGWSHIQCVAECHRVGSCVNVTLSAGGDLCSGYYRLLQPSHPPGEVLRCRVRRTACTDPGCLAAWVGGDSCEPLL